MKPIFKYSGGKTRELKRIKGIIRNVSIDRVIEPFAGGLAFSWFLEKPSIITDIRTNNIDVYNCIKNKNNFDILFDMINKTKQITDIKELEKLYYYWRDDKFNNCQNIVESAFRWILLRQLCFSGMDRINKKTGKTNVPFGWYKKFTCNLSEEHHNLIQNWKVYNNSFETIFNNFKENDFIFIDPPYIDRNSDYDGNYDDNLHNILFDLLKNIKTKFLLIHCDCNFYRDKYKSFNIISKDFSYSSQWKGRKQNNRKTKHLYITNFNLDLFF